jgi:hypothetical protein
MTDNAKPQAVPKCEHGETVFPHDAYRNIAGVVDCRYKCWGPQPTQAVQPPPIWDHQGDPRCVNSGCFNVRDHWINAPDSVPAQALGDEVHSSLASRESDGEITALALDYLANKDAIQAAVGPHFAELAKRHAAYMAWEHRLAAEQVGDHYASFLAGWHACELTSQSEDIQ